MMMSGYGRSSCSVFLMKSLQTCGPDENEPDIRAKRQSRDYTSGHLEDVNVQTLDILLKSSTAHILVLHEQANH